MRIHQTLWGNNYTLQEGYGNKKDSYILELIQIRCIHTSDKASL
jgi:hypothetical protein